MASEKDGVGCSRIGSSTLFNCIMPGSHTHLQMRRRSFACTRRLVIISSMAGGELPPDGEDKSAARSGGPAALDAWNAEHDVAEKG